MGLLLVETGEIKVHWRYCFCIILCMYFANCLTAKTEELCNSQAGRPGMYGLINDNFVLFLKKKKKKKKNIGIAHV